MVLEKTPESPLDCKGIKPVNLKGDKPWIVTGQTDAEAPVFWSSDANSQLTGKVSGAGKDWGQKEKSTSEDEMAGQHLMQWTWTWTNSRRWWGTGKTGIPWGHKESDMTGRLKNNNNNKILGLVFKTVPNASSCAWCTVRANKPKHQNLEHRKFYCKAQKGEQVAYAQNTPQSL